MSWNCMRKPGKTEEHQVLITPFWSWLISKWWLRCHNFKFFLIATSASSLRQLMVIKTQPGAWHVASHSIFTTGYWNRFYHCCHFLKIIGPLMAWGTESGFGQGDPVPEDLGLYIMCYPGLFTFTKMSTPHASDSLVWVVSIGRRVQS